MAKPAIFFDRDNTLILNDAFLGDPAEVKLIPGAADAIARGRALGFAIITASNQSGVARGFYPESTVEAVNARMDELLQKENPEAIIDRHEFCPFHPEARLEEYRQDSDLRKPKPGMFLRAAGAMDIDLKSSWLIGDAPRDIEAGQAAGCKTILVNDPSIPPSEAAGKPSGVEPDETVASLAEALDVIEAITAAEPMAAATSRVLSDLESSHNRLRQAGGAFEDPATRQRRENIPVKIIERDQTSGQEPATPTPPTIESTLGEILSLLRRRDQARQNDFSISKLLAGITQTLAVATAIAAYFYHNGNEPIAPLLIAIFLQAFTISLLLMARDRQ